MSETTQPGTIRVTAVLLTAPVWWTPDFWADSAREYDWVTAETPLAEKPWAEFDVSLDVTLGEVCVAACEAWGITLGDPAYETTLAEQFHRFAFVKPGEEEGLSDQLRYDWPPELAIAREDGTVERVFGGDATYRELLASSELGLIAGDIRRPYVDPVIPQGETEIVELLRLTLEAIQAAYGHVDQSIGGYAEHTLHLIRTSLPTAHRVGGEAVDDAVRVVFLVAAYRWVREKLRRRPQDN